MVHRSFLGAGLVAGSVASILIVACSSSTSSTTPIDGGSSPPGTTAVAAPPYPVCDPVPLGFSASSGYPTPKTTTCTTPGGGAASGAADTHCVGQTPQPVHSAACADIDAGAQMDDGADGGSDYGPTMFGMEADDDDCKYHVTWTSTSICENNDTYFVATATSLTTMGADGKPAPVTGASTQAQLFLGDSHVEPNIDAPAPVGKQVVVEGPPGTYTIGPVQFDVPGQWTVRFHFNEFCCDAVPDSPHGHAAFYLNVP